MNRYPCRRINFSRLLLLAVLFPCLLFASLATVACSDPEETKAEHVRKGESLIKERKFAEAELEFRNALQIDSNLASAYFGLAQANEGLERLPNTLDALRKTIEVDPNHLEARTKLANYYLVFSNSPNANKEEFLAEVERLSREVLERDPNNIEGHILNGNLLFVRGERGKALAEMQRAIEIDPKRIESHLSLARFYASAGDIAKADETYKRAIAMNDSFALGHTDYGRFLISLNRGSEAEAQFRRAIEVDKENREARRILASYYLVNRQLDRAEAEYRGLAELDRDRPEGPATLADYYSTVDRMDDAVRAYEEITQKFPDFPRARYRLGEIALQRGDLDGASKQIGALLDKNAQDTQALLLRARVSLQKNQPREAVKDLQAVLDIEPNSLAGLYYMADANLRIGQVAQAREFAAALARNYPSYLPARLLQVQVNLESGDTQAALRGANELIETLRRATPDAQTSPQLLTELRAKAFTARGAANLQAGNAAAARADMQASLEAAPNSAASYLNLARIAVRERKIDEAANLFERALQLDRSNVEALGGVVDIALARNNPDEAHRRVDEAINLNPRSAAPHFLKGQIFAYQRNLEAAEASFRRATEVDSTYTNAYFALANLFRNTNRSEQAIAEYQNLVQRQPDNIAGHTMLGIMEDDRNNYRAAAEAYRRAIDAEPNSVNNTFAANNLAWLAAEHNEGNLDEALKLAQDVVTRFPNEPGYIDTLGWVLHKKGLNAQAVDQLRKVVDISQKRGQDSALYRFHLAAALAGSGDRAAARRELEQVVRLAPTQPRFTKLDEARSMLATM